MLCCSTHYSTVVMSLRLLHEFTILNDACSCCSMGGASAPQVAVALLDVRRCLLAACCAQSRKRGGRGGGGSGKQGVPCSPRQTRDTATNPRPRRAAPPPLPARRPRTPTPAVPLVDFGAPTDSHRSLIVLSSAHGLLRTWRGRVHAAQGQSQALVKERQLLQGLWLGAVVRGPGAAHAHAGGGAWVAQGLPLGAGC
jgi:hypothetical protein